MRKINRFRKKKRLEQQRKEDEEQNMGVVKKIKHSSCFHIGQSIASSGQNCALDAKNIFLYLDGSEPLYYKI